MWSGPHTYSNPPCPSEEIIDRGKKKGHYSVTEQNTPPYIENIVAVIR
jgi:hypothetical protein